MSAVASLGARLRAHTSIPLYRNAYALMLSGGGSAALGVLYWALASRLYPAEVVGTSSSAIALLALLSGLATLYLDGSVVRFLPRAGRRTLRLVAVAYAITLATAVLAGLAFVAGVDAWTPALSFLGSSGWWIAGTIAAIMTSCVFALQDSVLVAMRRTVWVVPVENIAYGVLKIALLVAFAGVAGRNGILLSWVLPFLVLIPAVTLVLARSLPRHAAATAANEEVVGPRRIARYAAGNYVGYLCSLVTTRVPPLLVLNVAGASASAYFNLPWIIASTLSLLAVNMMVSLVVEGTVDTDNVGVHVRRAVAQIARIFVPVVLVLLVGAPYILRILGERYAEEGAPLLRLLALAALPNAFCVIAFGVARLQDRVGVLIASQFALAVAVIGLGAVLLPSMGLEGFGVAWLASQVALALVLGVTVLRPHRRVPARPTGAAGVLAAVPSREP